MTEQSFSNLKKLSDPLNESEVGERIMGIMAAVLALNGKIPIPSNPKEPNQAELAKIKSYVERTPAATENPRFSMSTAEWGTLVDFVKVNPSIGVVLAFDFGRVKGYRKALSESKKGKATPRP